MLCVLRNCDQKSEYRNWDAKSKTNFKQRQLSTDIATKLLKDEHRKSSGHLPLPHHALLSYEERMDENGAIKQIIYKDKWIIFMSMFSSPTR